MLKNKIYNITAALRTIFKIMFIVRINRVITQKENTLQTLEQTPSSTILIFNFNVD